jgi:ubiquinone/menaquinone biosynthesis C-methylase UbiE
MNRSPNFDRLASVYRWMEMATFGCALWHCRCRFLDELRNCRTALVLGDGDGRFTARLLQENPHVRVEVIDTSKAMLRALLRNAGVHRHRISVHHADARQWLPGTSHYDLVVSHFFLDCLSTDEVTALAERLRPCTSDQTRWVVSEFAIPAGWFGRLVAQPLVTSLYLAFRLLTGLRVGRLPQHRSALSCAGFVLDQDFPSLDGLLVSEMWVRALR